MIIGIVTEVAIFYFSEYQDICREHGRRSEALVAAGKNRMRPIAMTTIAAILTLLPLAFAIGQGSAMQQPLAIAIISGLVVQLPLVLLVMPVLLPRAGGKRGMGPEAQGHSGAEKEQHFQHPLASLTGTPRRMRIDRA